MEGIPSGLLNHWVALPIISVAFAAFLFKAITAAKRRRKPPAVVTPPPPPPNPSPLQIEKSSDATEDNKPKEKEQTALQTPNEKADAEESSFKAAQEEIALDKDDENQAATSVSGSGRGEEMVEKSGQIVSPIGILTRPPIPASLKKSGSFLPRFMGSGKSPTQSSAEEKQEGENAREDDQSREQVNSQAEKFIQWFKEQRRLSMARSKDDKDKDKEA